MECIRLRKKQVPVAARMLARAFHDDPLFQYWLPDSAERRKLAPEIIAVNLRHGVYCGEIYATSEALKAVAMWHPPEIKGLGLWETIRSGGLALLPKIGTEVARRIMYYEEQATEYRPDYRHWHLSAIGADPDSQGQGLASQLLAPMFQRFDREGLPCWLETHTKVNVDLYRHYNFQVVQETKLPDADFKIWHLVREPLTQ